MPYLNSDPNTQSGSFREDLVQHPQCTREYLLQGAAWQDSLLQSYRYLQYVFQCILLVAGIVLFAAMLGMENLVAAGLLLVQLILFFGLQVYTSRRLKGVILARGNDVTFWHKEIIRQERRFPPSERFFTTFKIWQKSRSGIAQPLIDLFLGVESTASDGDIEELLGKGIGYTRVVVDQDMVVYLTRLWAIIVALSCVYFAWRFLLI